MQAVVQRSSRAGRHRSGARLTHAVGWISTCAKAAAAAAAAVRMTAALAAAVVAAAAAGVPGPNVTAAAAVAAAVVASLLLRLEAAHVPGVTLGTVVVGLEQGLVGVMAQAVGV